MNFLDYNRVLLLAGAVALVGATACSRSDRADTGRDTTQSGSVNSAVTPADTHTATGQTPAADTGSAATLATPADTGKTAVTSKPKAPRTRMHPGIDSAQSGDQGAGYQEMGRDTTSPSEVNSNPSSEGTPSDTSQIRPTPDSGVSAAPSAPSPSDTASVGVSTTAGDTAAGEISNASADTNVPTADVTATDSTSVAVTDSAAAVPAGSDSVAVAAHTEGATDTSEVAADTTQVAAQTPAADTVAADTAAAGYSEMAGDSSSVLAQADTAASEAAPTADEDTANIEVQVDTATAEAAVGGDSVTVATGDANVASSDSEPIRPPEDSTETLGQVTTDPNAGAANETLPDQGEPIRPAADSAEVATSESSVEAAGAAPMGNVVTGADAVATMTRAGARCVVVREESPDVLWNMADSPSALNPCGNGTMTRSLVRVSE